MLAATADGSLTVLDTRRPDRLLVRASVSCGAPLRCCAADERLVLAGDEAGCVQLWDVGLMAEGRPAARQDEQPGPDGLYAPWAGAEAGGGAVSGLCVLPVGAEAGAGEAAGSAVQVALATEAGRLVVLGA